MSSFAVHPACVFVVYDALTGRWRVGVWEEFRRDASGLQGFGWIEERIVHAERDEDIFFCLDRERASVQSFQDESQEHEADI